MTTLITSNEAKLDAGASTSTSLSSTRGGAGTGGFNEYIAYEQKAFLLKERYRYISPIQEGGFGKVTLAFDKKRRTNVAMKAMYKSHRHTRRVAKHEIRILSKLGNKNDHICQLLDHFETSEFIVLVLEYCANGDLYELIHSSRDISAVDVWNIAKELASALKFAHSLGVYHRDIKPENVLFDSYGRVKLCDWGLSTTTRMTSEFNVGTEKYMAPECFMELPLITSYDCKYADYWSYAITLMATVFGTSPFKPVGGSSKVDSDNNFKNFVKYGNTHILYDIYPTMNENCFRIFSHLLKVGGPDDSADEFNRKVALRSLSSFVKDLQENWKFGLTIDEEDDLDVSCDDSVAFASSNELFSMDHDDIGITEEGDASLFGATKDVDQDFSANMSSDHQASISKDSSSQPQLVPSLIESSLNSSSSKSWCDLDDNDDFYKLFDRLTLAHKKHLIKQNEKQLFAKQEIKLSDPMFDLPANMGQPVSWTDF